MAKTESAHPRPQAAARGQRRARPRGGRARLLLLLGPAFVAAVAYVDPGNVAANLTAGARYGYLLVWVLVVANGMAVLVQHQSAKLGIVTGRSLPELLGERMRPAARRLYWAQAEIVAAATDVAEVIGGAVALHLLFGLPLPLGGLIVGLASMLLLALQSRRGQRSFELSVLVLLAVIAVGFLAGLVVSPVDWGGAADGLLPRFGGAGTVLIAASMLGATVMPHAVYLHSALARDHAGRQLRLAGTSRRDARTSGTRAGAVAPGVGADRILARLLRATRWDVLGALVIAGAVNVAMLLLAAASLAGVHGTDTIEGAHAAVAAALGPVVAAVFAVGLLASGLASTSVGSAAGAIIMGGLLKVRIPLLVRRAVTLVPALVLLGAGIDPTRALVLSQVLLSLGIPFALVPLMRYTGDARIMGAFADRVPVRLLAWTVTGLIVVLNVALVALTLAGAD